MYNVQFTIYNVQCTIYNVQCTIYNVQCLTSDFHRGVNEIFVLLGCYAA